MARFRAPANVQLRRAQLTLILATLVPTILMTALGIVLLATGSDAPSVVIGVLVLAFCTTSLTGYILGSIFLRRGAQVARFQNHFLSSVSHELRTPLTSISMFIDTLRDERLKDPERKAECLRILDQEVHRLQGLVERLLRLSRIEAGQHGFAREPVAIDDIIKDARIAFDAATINDPAALDLQLTPNLHVLGDRQALGQALTNLLINAWKYTQKDSRRIQIETRDGRRYVELVVRDNGPGIPRAEQRHVFGHFERGRDVIDDASRQGSGLGLAIVRAIVRAHRGRIDLKSKPGQGSEFRVRLRAA